MVMVVHLAGVDEVVGRSVCECGRVCVYVCGGGVAEGVGVGAMGDGAGGRVG